MDPPLISEGSFSTVNPSLAEIWPFGGGGGSGGVVGLGLRMGSGGGFGQGFVGGFVGGSGGSGGGGSVEESTVTEQSGSHGGGGGGGRKRRGAISEDEESKLVSSTSSGNELKQSNGKRMKILGSRDENMGLKSGAESSCADGNKLSKKSDQLAEPPKDYIHVRARRGQATDNHSLAERARREKISERMKILQDLVPGCNKAVGKALVLDEIINYIQSLQRQVEFLSLKLEAVNAAIFPTLNAFHSKDVNQLEGPSFESNGMIMSPQAAREYSAGPHHEWLHMQLSSAFERAS